MASTTLRGCDPTMLARIGVSISLPKNFASPTDIVDEGLFTVVVLYKRPRHSKATQGLATNNATSANIPLEDISRIVAAYLQCPALLRKTSS
ncbi:hypothetical protein MRX96_003060 [Rhipicephalus microplus]